MEASVDLGPGGILSVSLWADPAVEDGVSILAITSNICDF